MSSNDLISVKKIPKDKNNLRDQLEKNNDFYKKYKENSNNFKNNSKSPNKYNKSNLSGNIDNKRLDYLDEEEFFNYQNISYKSKFDNNKELEKQ